MHDRDTAEGEQQLHTHVVLPGTTVTLSGPEPFYNNKKEGHVALFNEIADKQFELALDKTIGLDWRALRPEPEPELEQASGPTSSAPGRQRYDLRALRGTCLRYPGGTHHPTDAVV